MYRQKDAKNEKTKRWKGLRQKDKKGQGSRVGQDKKG